MDCPGFERWLNEGRPARSAARRHAAECARCAAELAVAEALDGALRQRFATTPAAFTDRVMERIAAEVPAPPARIPAIPAPALPWWISVFQDPATVLSCVLAAVLLATLPALLAVAHDWATHAAALARLPLERFGSPGTAWWSLPVVALPILAVASAALYRGSLRWLDRRAL